MVGSNRAFKWKSTILFLGIICPFLMRRTGHIVHHADSCDSSREKKEECLSQMKLLDFELFSNLQLNPIDLHK